MRLGESLSDLRCGLPVHCRSFRLFPGWDIRILAVSERGARQKKHSLISERLMASPISFQLHATGVALLTLQTWKIHATEGHGLDRLARFPSVDPGRVVGWSPRKITEITGYKPAVKLVANPCCWACFALLFRVRVVVRRARSVCKTDLWE